MAREFDARRHLIVDGLNAIPGVSCAMPRGAFYAFAVVSALPFPAVRLAVRLLDEAGVATLAGTAFGARGAGHLRISYATAESHLHEALRRIAELTALL
jgi:aspartate/methionine/tyrosine aminotransferase